MSLSPRKRQTTGLSEDYERKQRLPQGTDSHSDFGSQYTQLIARKTRELGVYCEIYPFNMDMEKIVALDPHGIILSGGPKSVNEENAPICDEKIFNLGIPILGICYGLQLTARFFGGRV